MRLKALKSNLKKQEPKLNLNKLYPVKIYRFDPGFIGIRPFCRLITSSINSIINDFKK